VIVALIHSGALDELQQIVRKLGRKMHAPVAALEAFIFTGRKKHEVVATLIGDDDRFCARAFADLTNGAMELPS
jgi:hypothetical protein